MSVSAPPLDPSVTFALLAAGSSTRFGDSGKLDAVLGHKPLWRWAAEAAVAAGFMTRMLIVSSDLKGSASAVSEGWSIAVNPDPAAGISGSIKLACAQAAACKRLVIALADMPFVESDHLRILALGNGVSFTRYPSGRDGVPAAFPRTTFAVLRTLQGDRGAASHPWDLNISSIKPRSPDSLIDVDTPEQLERAGAILAAR